MRVLQGRNVVLRAAAGVVPVVAWAYWPTLQGLVATWSRDPNYSQGFLVPVIALGILRHRCRGAGWGGAACDPLGVGVLLLATALRLAGAYYYVTPLDHLSLLLVLAGVCLVLGGRPWLGRAWPAIAFLVFMIPIPRSLGGTPLTGPLQQVATTASTFLLQTLGVTAQREGNIIILKNAELGIVEACSGLRMLMVFCAMATATAILLPYGWKRRTILVTSAVPLALVCNVVRITAAGIAGDALGKETGHFVFHDLAGYLMVPLAFALLGTELLLLSRLFRTGAEEAPSLQSLELLLASPHPVAPGHRAGQGGLDRHEPDQRRCQVVPGSDVLDPPERWQSGKDARQVLVAEGFPSWPRR